MCAGALSLRGGGRGHAPAQVWHVPKAMDGTAGPVQAPTGPGACLGASPGLFRDTSCAASLLSASAPRSDAQGVARACCCGTQPVQGKCSLSVHLLHASLYNGACPGMGPWLHRGVGNAAVWGMVLGCPYK